MATLTVDFFSSLDGNGSAHGWPGYWGKEGPELREYLVQKYARDQVLVYGATTFRAFREFVVEYDEPYYESLNALPKIVFSSTLQEPLGWSNSTVISEDAVIAMTRLKRETDKPMRSHGSISLNRALLAAGLVDFLEVTVFPAITGKDGYAALFQDGPGFDLDLVESTVLDGRTLKLVYVPHLHTGIPEGVGPQRRET
jgi:dihydrofolate reductase